METSRISPAFHTALQHLLHKTANGKLIQGTVLCVETADGSLKEIMAAGNLSPESQYFIASTTKLYTTALVFQLRHAGKLSLDDSIAALLPESIVKGLHVYRGTDYSRDIAVRHLLSQTSGLPDYFQGKGPDGQSLEKQISSGKDKHWSFEEAVSLSKQMKPRFRPGQPRKAHYSDTNYQLLGSIITHLTGKSVAQAYRDAIFDPLGLTRTYLFENTPEQTPEPMFYKHNRLDVRKAMSSFGPDGGIVSTAAESMVFLRAFFNGTLFPATYITEIQQWNNIFFPLQYGIGLSRFKLPRIFSPFRAVPEFIGHSGLSGAFAYYVPAKHLYLTGTVNQVYQPGASYRLMLKVLNLL